MALKNQYLIELLERVKKRNANEPEFIQTVTEVFESIEPVIEKRQDLGPARFPAGLAAHRTPVSKAKRVFEGIRSYGPLIGIVREALVALCGCLAPSRQQERKRQRHHPEELPHRQSTLQ